MAGMCTLASGASEEEEEEEEDLDDMIAILKMLPDLAVNARYIQTKFAEIHGPAVLPVNVP